MLKNFIKIAWRSLTKNGFYSLVNITGLSIGIAFTMIIFSFVWSEMEVNAHLKNKSEQYIIQSKWRMPDMGFEIGTLAPLAKELHIQYPNLVANYYRFDGVSSNVSKDQKVFREIIQIGDTSMLNMFGFELQFGNPEVAWAHPFSVVISDAVAEKYFGKKDVIGQYLTIENFSGKKHDFLVTGVMKPLKRNSVTRVSDDSKSGLFVSEKDLPFFGRFMDKWSSTHIAGYLQLQKGVKPSDLAQPMQMLIAKNAPKEISANLTPELKPLSTYYLNFNNGMVQKMIYALSFIALFIVMMAVINFVNMSVSRSSTRIKEIGIRKVMGSNRRQLILQFLLESIILVALSGFLAFGIYVLSADFFAGILGKKLPSLFDLPIWFYGAFLLFVFLVGSIAGLYPALVLSSVNTVLSVKGKLNGIKDHVVFRKSLLGFQFSVAVLVFIAAITVTGQINYFLGNSLGYDKDYVLSAQVPRDWTPEGVSKMESIRQQFASLPQVKNVSLSYEIPNGNNSGSVTAMRIGGNPEGVASQLLISDEHFASTYQIPLIAGEFFGKPGSVSDTNKIVINEAEVKAMGWESPQDALGRTIRIDDEDAQYTISGVVKDFHFGTMQQAIPPIIFFQTKRTSSFRYLSFKLAQGNVAKAVKALEEKWSQLLPGAAFEYAFMDDSLAKMYRTELQLQKSAYTGTAMALIILLLGILGLVAVNIQRRSKEIGIRKVLGSSAGAIIYLFIKEFIGVIVIAGVVACPIAYVILNKWLQGYAYRIELTAYPFALAIFSLLVTTVLVILFRTIRTANMNPVDSIKAD